MHADTLDRMKKWLATIALAPILVIGSFGCAEQLGDAEIVVFAPASTIDALGEICALFEARFGVAVLSSFGASSTLARQVEAGAPADVVLSANSAWMDYLEKAHLLAPNSRREILGNRLVLIAPVGRAQPLALTSELPLIELLDDRPLAMADPEHVPAGIYAKAALESLGFWEIAGERAVRTTDVRAALALVERGESNLGIVYATDAFASGRVGVVATFPDVSHPGIVVSTAIVAGRATPDVRSFHEFLASPEAMAVFARYGFPAA